MDNNNNNFDNNSFSNEEIEEVVLSSLDSNEQIEFITAKRREAVQREMAEQRRAYEQRRDEEQRRAYEQRQASEQRKAYEQRRQEEQRRYSEQYRYDNRDDYDDCNNYDDEKPRRRRREVQREDDHRKRSSAKPPKKTIGKGRKMTKKTRALIIIIAIFVAILAYVGLSALSVKNEVSDLKDSLEVIVECVKNKETNEAQKAEDELNKVDKLIKKLQNQLKSPLFKAVSGMPKIGEDVKSAGVLLDMAAEASTKILHPLINLMKDYPISGLKVGDGFNAAMIIEYISLLEQIAPDLEKMVQTLSTLKFNVIDKDGKIASVQEKIVPLMEQYDAASAYIPLLKTFLGNGEDRLYLLVAQNSAEIRATGGFPGSIGTIEITDGILSIGEFKSVYDQLYYDPVHNVELTYEEWEVFGDWLTLPWDSCFISDFPRAAEIWAVAYENNKKYNQVYDENGNYVGGTTVDVDGVVSMTPAIIQKILAVTEPITAEDGTVLDGTNATKVLQHDWYHQYFDNNHNAYMSNYYVDGLFASTAKQAMHNFTSSFEISKLVDYFTLFEDGVKERIIMMWMEDSEEEAVIESVHATGGLNRDAQNPVTGIYFSLADPCKLGWYLDINTSLSEPETGENGRKTYHVTVDLVNNFLYDDYYNYDAYVVGSCGGGIRAYMNIFAPQDADIYNVYITGASMFHITMYSGLSCAYNNDILVPAEGCLTITYDIVLPAGVETPLQVVTTPTLTAYRN